MQAENHIEVVHYPIAAAYTTDSFRKVRDPETGKVEVKRWIEAHQIEVSVQVDKKGGRVFHRGARIA